MKSDCIDPITKTSQGEFFVVALLWWVLVIFSEESYDDGVRGIGVVR